MMQFLRRCSRNWFGVFAILIGLVFCPSLWAANIYVAADGTGDGLSTTNPANLQIALGYASTTAEDHTLFLEQGTYTATVVTGFKITAVNNSVEKSITLSGGWSNGFTIQSTDRETTKLDGGNAVRVLDILTENATMPIHFYLDNLTVERGYVTGAGNSGAGIRVSYSGGVSPILTISNCLFRSNSTTNSAGAILSYVYFEVHNSIFSSNSASTGGAIYTAYATPLGVSPLIDGCTFDDNRSTGWQGSAIHNANVNLTVQNSTFTGRTDGISSSGPGSTIYSHTGAYLSVYNSVFRNNIIDYWGSAIQLWDAGGNVVNTVFIGNKAGIISGYGAIAYLNNSGAAEALTISNCTFVNNQSAGDFAGAIHNRGANLTIANSIFWDNGTYGIYSEYGNAAINYSDVQGGLTSTGFTDGGNNISVDPGFAAGEYHLPAGSPCIDTGSNAAAAGITTDIDGEPRIFNGTVDMGADEFVPMVIISPDNAATFDACSYFAPPLFQWKLYQSFEKLAIHFFTPSNPAKPTKIKLKDPAALGFPMIDKTWKKILKLTGLSGGQVNWKLVGTNKGQPIVESDVFTMTIAALEPAGKPDINPLNHTATWGNSCGTKFKIYFGSDENFAKKKKLSFKVQNPTDNGGVFSTIISDKTWASLEKLVEGLVPPRVYFYVESWDIIKRYQKTDVAYIDLDI